MPESTSGHFQSGLITVPIHWSRIACGNDKEMRMLFFR
jgi:hypothetical protein